VITGNRQMLMGELLSIPGHHGLSEVGTPPCGDTCDLGIAAATYHVAEYGPVIAITSN
jgi:hypothetical protein